MLHLDFLRRAIEFYSKKTETWNHKTYVTGVVYVRDNVGTPIRELKVKEKALALHQKSDT